MQYEYLWADGVKVKKPIKLTAPQYVNALFDWIEEQVRLQLSHSNNSVRYVFRPACDDHVTLISLYNSLEKYPEALNICICMECSGHIWSEDSPQITARTSM